MKVTTCAQMKKHVFRVLLLLITVFSFFDFTDSAFALPAFAKKEDMPCALCHTNGAAPHLTKTGYMYRRAGFRFPANIGNKEADEKMEITRFFSAGLNTSYENVSNKAPEDGPTVETSNQFNLPGLALFPLVGGFLGNYGMFSEADFTPGTTDGPTGAQLATADMRFVMGNKDRFINFRTGYLVNEGYGAADQWIDDGNIPMIDTLTAQYNQDTLTLPYGANAEPQLGSEFGVSICEDTHITFGIYNGFDGAGGLSSKTQSTLTAALMNSEQKTSKDYRLQIDQFITDHFNITASYYKGAITLLDPSNTVAWLNKYDNARVYLTASVMPEKVDLLAGMSSATHHWVNSGSSDIAGTFRSRGGFFGANYYVMQHLTLSGRADYFQYATADFPASARGFALMASLPYDNNLFVFHYNQTSDDMQGLTKDFRVEWRFFY